MDFYDENNTTHTRIIEVLVDGKISKGDIRDRKEIEEETIKEFNKQHEEK